MQRGCTMLVVLWAWMSGIRQLLITVIHIGLDMFRTSTWLVKTCDPKCFFCIFLSGKLIFTNNNGKKT